MQISKAPTPSASASQADVGQPHHPGAGREHDIGGAQGGERIAFGAGLVHFVLQPYLHALS